MQPSVEITGSKAFKAAVVRAMCMSRYTMLLAVVILAPLAWYAWNGEMKPLGIALGVMAFGWHVIHGFVRDVLENESSPLKEGAEPAMYLSADIIRNLFPKRKATAGLILDSALHTRRGMDILVEIGVNQSALLSACYERMESEVDTAAFLTSLKQGMADSGETRIDAPLILYKVLTELPEGKALLNQADISNEMLSEILAWEQFKDHFKKKASFLDAQRLAQAGALGRSWVRGYTDALDKLTTEISAVHPTAGEQSVAIHQKDIQACLNVLNRSSQKNVLLLGNKDVGKRTMAINVARAIRDAEREQHASFTRILKLRTDTLLSSGDGRPDQLLYKALETALDGGKFLLIIENIAQLYKSASEELKAVLQTYVEKKEITIIGIADTQDYYSVIKQDPGIDNQFEKMTIENATDDETLTVLMAHALSMKTDVRITARAIHSTLDLCKKYLNATHGMPGVAIQVLDESIQRAETEKSDLLTEEHIRSVITVRSKINVQAMNDGDKEKLLNLESTMKQQIIGQDAAVKAVCGALKRARIDISERKRPLGTFLFLGPTGVGKTETAKVLAEQYFGSRDAIIRLDMNEYAHPDSAFGIIGSAHPGSADGFLSQRVQEKPFSVILLDELEKADKSILNLFLQVLDEGRLTDARGQVTDFRHTIIIATSNAGALFMRDLLKQQEQLDEKSLKSSLLNAIIEQQQFSPEFVNRFDEVVVFKPLSKENTLEVAKLMVQDVAEDVLQKRGIVVHVSDEALQALAEIGYSTEFGAREMRRTVTERIENYIAEVLLSSSIGRGEVINVEKENIEQ